MTDDESQISDESQMSEESQMSSDSQMSNDEPSENKLIMTLLREIPKTKSRKRMYKIFIRKLIDFIYKLDVYKEDALFTRIKECADDIDQESLHVDNKSAYKCAVRQNKDLLMSQIDIYLAEEDDETDAEAEGDSEETDSEEEESMTETNNAREIKSLIKRDLKRPYNQYLS
jgi:hypothetical protein